jgi:hypothetical protein
MTTDSSTHEPIPFRGSITRELFLRAQRLHAGRRRLILWAFPGIFLILIALGWNGMDRAPLAVKAEALVLTFLFPILMMLFQRWQWGRQYMKSPLLQEPIWGAVSEEQLELHGAHGDSRLPWSLFVKRKQVPGLVLLYQSPYAFNLLARELFVDDAAWEAALRVVSVRGK